MRPHWIKSVVLKTLKYSVYSCPLFVELGTICKTIFQIALLPQISWGRCNSTLRWLLGLKKTFCMRNVIRCFCKLAHDFETSFFKSLICTKNAKVNMILQLNSIRLGYGLNGCIVIRNGKIVWEHGLHVAQF